MNRLAAIAFTVLAGAFTASSLQAQSHEVRANVPFAFAVGTKELPAGHYTFFSEPNDTIVIRSDNYKVTILSRTEESTNQAGYKSRLVFDRYGDHYFLREIRCPSIALNVEIPPSKLEKQTSKQMAWKGPDQTLVALN